MHEARAVQDGDMWRCACSGCGWLSRPYALLDDAVRRAVEHFGWWAYGAMPWKQCDDCAAAGLRRIVSPMGCHRCRHNFWTARRNPMYARVYLVA